MFGKRQILAGCAAVFAVFALAPAALAAPRATTASGLLRAVNETRAAHGLRPLKVDATLVRAARAHSLEMLQGGFFSHGDFHGRMVAFHVTGPQAGENLAWGNGSYAQPSSIVAEWLASPGHRANLLRSGWTRIGIGVVQGTFMGYAGSSVVTADFAGR